jgi:arylsulfatase A-like enzyme
VHFQTVDVHRPQRGVLLPPFSGLYLEPARRAEYLQWDRQVGHWAVLELFEEAGVDRLEFYDRVQRLYSEGMAAQDHQIGKLVERLKRTGEWSNTLFIVAADHGQFETGLVQLEPYPPYGQHTNLRPERTRVPMIFVWPGHIAGGQRFTDPVSMIDMLPTVLDLAELPPPEVMQGQSLAPLLLGTGGWEPRPVILDEFYVDSESGELRGWLEVIDGRWGASLAINPHPEGLSPLDAALPGQFIEDQRGERPAPLLIYDLWNDPYCLNSLHEERPDLVEKYTELLEAQWAANQVLAQRFPQAER